MPAVSKDDEHVCPEGAIVGHAKNCYHVHIKESSTWETVRLECVIDGGTLLTIHSKEENDIITDIISGIDAPNFWIGAAYTDLFGPEWSWVDHTSFNYSNFDPGIFYDVSVWEPLTILEARTPCHVSCNAYISGSNVTVSDGPVHEPGRWYVALNQDERHDYICQVSDTGLNILGLDLNLNW